MRSLLRWPGDRSCCPSDSCEQLDAEQQRAALAHEIAHLVRRDPAWRILAGVLERVFFFQPLNRIARVKLCESADFLCDQWAVQHTRSPLALARCLSAVASWTSPASDELLAGASPMARQRFPAGSPRDPNPDEAPRRSRGVRRSCGWRGPWRRRDGCRRW